jgi:hypothetical protein
MGGERLGKSMIVFGIIIFLFFLLVLLSVTKLFIDIEIKHGYDNDHIRITFSIWFRIIRYTIDIPFVKIDTKEAKIVFQEQTVKKSGEKKNKKERSITPEKLLRSLHNTKEIIRHVVKLHKIVQSFLQKVSVQHLEWHTVIGFHDAALTGVITGGIWSIKGWFLRFLYHHLQVKSHPSLTVTPSFQQAVTQFAFSCMIYFRIGHAILVAIKMIKHWRGGKVTFKSKTPFSSIK